jgi:hypothetical protein
MGKHLWWSVMIRVDRQLKWQMTVVQSMV